MADNKKRLSDQIKIDLKSLFDEAMKEDQSARERQIRKWRRLKLLWEGFQRIWYSETAHDWRIWNEQLDVEASSDQSYYDKPINVFKAYLESIIAALSVTVPAIKNFPEDAENALDLSTARGSDKVAELIYRHNDVILLWLHALFVFSTEGMTACYSYTDSDESYGTYKEEVHKDVTRDVIKSVCPECGYEEELDNKPQTLEPDICPECGAQVTPELNESQTIEDTIDRIDIKPKTRVCMKVYGGLYIKVGNYAKYQADIPYLIYSCERDSSILVEEYEDELKDDEDKLDKLRDYKQAGAYDQYAQWGRLNPQYQSEFPRNVLTENIAWIRPCRFNRIADKARRKALEDTFPNGVRMVVIGDEFICARDESLDKHWTLTENPMADYLSFEPAGESLTSVQDITNDLISLTLQTIEHGIGQTFVSPETLSLKAYSQTEATPGGIYVTKPIGTKRLSDGFHELKTATLSGEVLPFSAQIQSMAQLASGALPSLFGGQLEGSETASQYSMSRNQALQRLQNVWKIYTVWWKKIFAKNIPMFIAEMKEDERDVQQDRNGNFINVIIERSELTGKVGKVELESSENLPITWGQRRDIIEKLLINGNPRVVEIINAPENRGLLHEYLGLVDFYVPGEDDMIKQYDEIRQLLESEPITDEVGNKVPSIEIDPIFDNNQIEFEIVRKWVISDEGRLAKINNPPGHENVLLHGMQHYQQIQMQMQQQQMAAAGDGANPAKPEITSNREAPIEGENNVPTIQ